jgi:hypothetical protein
MDEKLLNTIYKQLKQKGIIFEDGLTDEEIEQIEQHDYLIKFPKDLKAFLQYKLPISDGFPNWRDESKIKITKWLNEPLQGICFDIDNNNFGLNSWGTKPTSLEDCFRTATYHVYNGPELIPIYKHRYIPSEPLNEGNPVLSVWQTDIFYYGYDLIDYFINEFNLQIDIKKKNKPRKVRFWDQFLT